MLLRLGYMFLLVCNWPHSIEQNHFFVMMLLHRDSAIQGASRRFCTVYKSEKSNPLQPSGRRDIPSRRPTVETIIRRMTRTFHLDLPLCREASNCSSSHLSERFNSTSRRHSMFDQPNDFFPKHRYGKFAAIIRTMWTPVQTCSSIRQVSHSKSRRPDASLHGPDARASDMEITCIRSIVWTTIPLVRTHEGLIWKLLVVEVRPSERQGNTIRMRLKLGKNFSEILESRSHSCPSGRPMTSVWMAPRFYQARRSFEPAAYK